MSTCIQDSMAVIALDYASRESQEWINQIDSAPASFEQLILMKQMFEEGPNSIPDLAVDGVSDMLLNQYGIQWATTTLVKQVIFCLAVVSCANHTK